MPVFNTHKRLLLGSFLWQIHWCYTITWTFKAFSNTSFFQPVTNTFMLHFIYMQTHTHSMMDALGTTQWSVWIGGSRNLSTNLWIGTWPVVDLSQSLWTGKLSDIQQIARGWFESKTLQRHYNPRVARSTQWAKLAPEIIEILLPQNVSLGHWQRFQSTVKHVAFGPLQAQLLCLRSVLKMFQSFLQTEGC